MTTSHTTTPATSSDRDRPVEVPWVREGLVAGVLGAASIALVFFLVDLANGRPLWTPHALGTALFLGEVAPPDAAPSKALIGGFTVIHGWVFVSVALIVASLMAGSRLPGEQRWQRILVLAVPLFVGFSAVFLVFALLRGPEAARPFGYPWLVVTNAIAAFVMAAWLVIRLPQPET
jgi:hypothetical protein